MIKHRLAKMQFLCLPFELRLQIYGYISYPHDAPLSQYQGLYLSCSQIKNELDDEGTKVVRAFFSRLEARLKTCTITTPSSLVDMQHIYVRTGIQSKITGKPCGWIINPDLDALFDLRLTSLTILTQFGGLQAVSTDVIRIVIMLCRKTSEISKGKANIGRISVELPPMDGRQAGYITERVRGFRQTGEEYMFRLDVQPGELVKAVWEIKGPKEQIDTEKVLRALQGLAID
jgi:hypothetical protein